MCQSNRVVVRSWVSWNLTSRNLSNSYTFASETMYKHQIICNDFIWWDIQIDIFSMQSATLLLRSNLILLFLPHFRSLKGGTCALDIFSSSPYSNPCQYHFFMLVYFGPFFSSNVQESQIAYYFFMLIF